MSDQAKYIDAIGAYLVSGFYTFVRDGIATPAGIRGSRGAELIDMLGAENQLTTAVRERFVQSSAAIDNKTFVLTAFDTLFNKRDYRAAEAYWSPDYIQHSANVPQGRAGLFDLVKSLPPSLKYEHDVVMADGDVVVLHGRFSGTGFPASWIAMDIVRLHAGRLVEHWDVLQDEATRSSSKSGLPMYGTAFPS